MLLTQFHPPKSPTAEAPPGIASSIQTVVVPVPPPAGVMATDRVLLLVSPPLSVTVRVTVKVPAAAYVLLTVAPLPLVPSPKFQA